MPCKLRIIIFGEDISDLGIWKKLLRQNKYIYQNEKWGNQTDMSPTDIIDKSIALDSDGTNGSNIVHAVMNGGHNTFLCDYPEDEWRPTFVKMRYDRLNDDRKTFEKVFMKI